VVFFQKLCRRFFKKIFFSLLLGGKILFVSSPSEISVKTFQKEVLEAGCLYADNSYRAKIFLSQVNKQSKNSSDLSLTLPVAIVIYNVHAHQDVVSYAREKAIPVLGIFKHEDSSLSVDFPLLLPSKSSEGLLCYWLLLHTLRRFRQTVTKIGKQKKRVTKIKRKK
jgi:ribosomal protein S2